VWGQTAAKPILDILTTTIGQMGDLLFAVSTAIDALGYLAYLCRRQSLRIKKAEQFGTLLTLIANQTQNDRVEVAAPTAGNAKRELEAIAVPATTSEAVTLFVGMSLDKHAALMNHQGVKD